MVFHRLFLSGTLFFELSGLSFYFYWCCLYYSISIYYRSFMLFLLVLPAKIAGYMWLWPMSLVDSSTYFLSSQVGCSNLDCILPSWASQVGLT